MYHTEVYLDQKTYFAKGHIWTKVMLFQGAVCYLWYVSKSQRLDESEFEREMSFWMREELPGVLEKKSIFIQKALNRLAGGFFEGELHLYYRGKFFSSSSDIQKGIVILGKGKGMYISKALQNIFMEFGIAEMEKELSHRSVEQMANEWKVRLLKHAMQESMEGVYLLFWEENFCVV